MSAVEWSILLVIVFFGACVVVLTARCHELDNRVKKLEKTFLHHLLREAEEILER